MEADELLFYLQRNVEQHTQKTAQKKRRKYKHNFLEAHRNPRFYLLLYLCTNSKKLRFWPFLTINLPLKAKQGINKADGKIEQDLHILLDEYVTQYTKTMCNLMT